ncbi:hypothetical protein QE152_g22843 [Popillia japonica]|uniref:Uncharacterized protein n=1 Tax=Popillia japonica TaxID=7064 RepID=A0AAW1KHL3_POPJA
MGDVFTKFRGGPPTSILTWRRGYRDQQGGSPRTRPFHCTSGGPPTSILTWRRGYRDQQGGSPRTRPFHCTSVGLTSAITPNAGNSGA